jgi:NAD-dependent deacetylase
MSAESGLPTFRGVDGYWGRYRVEDLASPEGFKRDPITVWRWYNERIQAHHSARPNAGHCALAELERLLPSVTIATQNVDSLHTRAGSVNVLELHGHLRDARCTKCGEIQSLANGLPESSIYHVCGGCFRPQVVWFGEELPAKMWAQAQVAAVVADVILVVGTSAQVYPAAALGLQNRNAFLAEINPENTPMSSRCDCVLRRSAAEALPKIVDGLRE